ncbi:uncharacterized protein LOC121729608, partial [Aricia agestis]|uniref:uncharacterized protein LOC121729608 n=1 Tax=Aricia agestis TaxID=91739 RepID=UPI001C205E60
MDILSDLKRVSNLDEYILVTQDIVSKHLKFPVLFNMSTVLSLKKVKTLEIDYFNKFNEHGAAVIILKLILRHPPSKTWALLGKELISLIKYWFEVIRKRLIFNNNRWWNFTITLIAFIESMCVKSKTVHDVIVQETCECLLDLATHNRTDLNQCYEIIRCFNACCAESSRTVRIALKTNLDIYLARVAGAVRASGDARVQLAGTQTLVR